MKLQPQELLKQMYLNMEFMMMPPHIKFIYIFIFIFSQNVSAGKVDSCINHLGGGRSDIYCYSYFIHKNKIQIESVNKKILLTIPRKSKYRKILKNYISNDSQSKIYCNLNKAALSEWNINKYAGTKEFLHVNDIYYYACMYNQSNEKVKLINNLLNATSPNGLLLDE